MKKIIFAALSALLNAGAAIAGGLPSNFISITQMHIDSDRRAHGFEWYLKDRDEKEIRKSIADYQKTDPRYLRIFSTIKPSAKTKGEETYYDLPIPSGYHFCGIRIGVRSITPGDGDKASIIKASVFDRYVRVYTWTPANHFWEGKAWVEADIQVFGMWERYVEGGACENPPPSFECKGNPCPGLPYQGLNRITIDDLNQGF